MRIFRRKKWKNMHTYPLPYYRAREILGNGKKYRLQPVRGGQGGYIVQVRR